MIYKKKTILGLVTLCSILSSGAYAKENTLQLEFPSSFFNEFSDEKQSDFWKNYSYSAESIINNLSNIGTYGAIKLHDKFDLENKTEKERILFLLTVGSLKAKFDFTNTVFFGHEFIHFQNGNNLGGSENYFRNSETGEEVSFLDFYLELLISGKTQGPAVTKWNPEDYQDFINNPKRIQHISNPLNWQMEYSSKWIEDSLLNENKTVFDISNFLFNRGYMTSYYIGDLSRGDGFSGEAGDPWKYAKHLEQFTNNTQDENLKKITTISAISMLLSHSLWSHVNNYESYISTGDYKIENEFIKTPLGEITWDIETYQNVENFSIKPKVFFNREENGFKADKLLYSVGFEQSVLGNDESELTLGIHGKWGEFSTSTEMSFNDSNQFLELYSGYKFNEKSELFAKAQISNGTTLKGERLAPGENSNFALGIKVNF